MSEVQVAARADIRRLYWSAFLLRFGLGCLILAIASSTSTPLLEDAGFYEEVGAGIAADWLSGTSSAWLTHAIAGGTSAWVLPMLIGCVYWLMGGLRATYVLVAVISAITSYTPGVTYRLALELGATRSAARYAGRLVVFSPCFAFWSGAFYKDGLVLLALSVAALQIIRLQRGWNTRAFLSFLAVLPPLFGLRFYMAMIIVSVYLASFLAGGAGPTARRTGLISRLTIAAAFLAIATAGGLTARMLALIPDDPSEAFKQIETTRSALSESSSGFLQDQHVTSPSEALRIMPEGTFRFLVEPLPWNFGSLRQNLVIPETLFWLLLYPVAFVGMRVAWRHNRQGAFVVVFATVVISLFYGIFAGNIGTAYRLRAQVWVLWAVFVGIGVDHRLLTRLGRPKDPHMQRAGQNPLAA